MKHFETVRMYCALFGIEPKQFHFPFNRKYLMITSMGGICLSSGWIFMFRVADSIEEYMDSFYGLIIVCSIFASYTTTMFNMRNLFKFFDDCETFLDDDSICDENRTKKEIQLNKTNDQVEVLSKAIYFVMVILITSALTLPKTIDSIYVYLTTDSGSDAFELSLPVWIPFDWKNPIGYSCAFIFEVITISFPLHYLSCFVSLALGAYLFATSINAYMNDDLKEINEMVKSKNAKSDILQKLSLVIRAHTKVKQVIMDFSEVYETTLTLLFLGCTVTASITMLMIQIEISQHEIDFFMLCQSIFYGAAVFAGVFFTCELGQRFSNSFEEIEAMMGKLDWYRFPGEIQRLLPTIIMNVQRPILIKCFGNVLCSRDQFKKVANTAYQYFMVLRELYK